MGGAGLIVALIAMVVAMSGAALGLPGKGSVDSGDIKKNAVKGNDVKESSLATVPNAASADNADAVSGIVMRTFSFGMDPDGAGETFEFGGVRISGNCASGETNPDLANISGQDAQAFSGGVALEDPATRTTLARRDEELESGDSFSLDDDVESDDGGQATAQVIFADGSVTTIEASWSNDDLDNTAGCNYWGRITAG